MLKLSDQGAQENSKRLSWADLSPSSHSDSIGNNSRCEASGIRALSLPQSPVDQPSSDALGQGRLANLQKVSPHYQINLRISTLAILELSTCYISGIPGKEVGWLCHFSPLDTTTCNRIKRKKDEFKCWQADNQGLERCFSKLSTDKVHTLIDQTLSSKLELIDEEQLSLLFLCPHKSLWNFKTISQSRNTPSVGKKIEAEAPFTFSFR